MKRIKFPYKRGDTVIFPDTETEYVDVEVGYVPVAQQPVNTICNVVRKSTRKGRRKILALKIRSDNYYSEAFSKRSGYIYLREYLEYFGNYKQLIKIRL